MERIVKSLERVRDLGEVFTPRFVVDEMLDLLPAATWEPDPPATFLEPACGDGNFLVAVLERKLAVARERAGVFETHALGALGSLHGVDICEANVLAARERLLQVFGREVPGARRVEREARRIVGRNVRVDDMLAGSAFAHVGGGIDVVVGNPPYQVADGGAGASASPVYHRFVESARALGPRHVVMITPSRWMSGGKGLDRFRDGMLRDRRLRAIVDHQDAAVVFPGLNVNGGVSWFHWDRDHEGACAYTSVSKSGRRSTVARDLGAHDILVRLNEALPIVEKVRAKAEPTFEHRVSPRRPFGFDTRFRGRPGTPPEGALTLQARTGGWVTRDEVKVNRAWIDAFKLFVPRATDGNEIWPLPVLTPPILAEPGTVCSETYLLLGPFATRQEAEHCASYVQTRFFRFLLSLRKPTQDNRRDRFRFIPDVDLGRPWSDEHLYERYGITPAEQAYIAEVVRASPRPEAERGRGDEGIEPSKRRVATPCRF